MEQRERQVLADRQGLIARGATEDLPNFATVQLEFDEWLIAEPQPAPQLSSADIEKQEELRALGVIK
jgi:hypothetical protein